MRATSLPLGCRIVIAVFGNPVHLVFTLAFAFTTFCTLLCTAGCTGVYTLPGDLEKDGSINPPKPDGTPGFCGDGECRFAEGEDCTNCPEDCGICIGSCGNGVIDQGETCDPPASCPTSCDDASACTTDIMTGDPSTCDVICTHDPVVNCVDGDGCCPVTCNSSNDDDCTAACGNGVVDQGETCDPPSTCPTTCNDGNACTQDIMSGDPSTCNAACANNAITACAHADGCCPTGCNASNDNDCPASCGDSVCSGSENTANCWQDCGTHCGDSACNGSESTVNCPDDCGTLCGDSACNGSETCQNCAQDCGTCPAVCGDGQCNGSETYFSCPSDCGGTNLTFCSSDCTYPTISADSAGKVMVVWSDRSSGKGQLKYTCYNGSTWTHPQSCYPVNSFQEFPRVAVDSIGRFHLVWNQGMGSGRQIRYLRFDGTCSGGSWIHYNRVDKGSGLNSCWPQIALDANDHPHVTWTEDYWEIHYNRKINGWLDPPVVVVDTVGENSCHSDIAMVAGNRPAIVWMEGNGPRLPTFSEEDPPGSGNFTTPHEITSVFHGWPQIVADGSDNLHFSYTYRHSGNDVKYKRRKANGNWMPAQPSISSSSYVFSHLIASGSMLFAAFSKPVSGYHQIFFAEGDSAAAMADTWGSAVQATNTGRYSLLPRIAVVSNHAHLVWVESHDPNEEVGGVMYRKMPIP